MNRLRQRMLEEHQRLDYAQATIDAYIFAVQEFSQTSGSSLCTGAKHFRRYQLNLLKEKQIEPICIALAAWTRHLLYSCNAGRGLYVEISC